MKNFYFQRFYEKEPSDYFFSGSDDFSHDKHTIPLRISHPSKADHIDAGVRFCFHHLSEIEIQLLISGTPKKETSL
ncbi:4016_t:CDS:2 [Funneliformis geosporum]|uniref:4016_t:CDS:1 n=1 Tax=Funneliformis geosporum TaxID=1117311 RepID=A0A9W4SGY8_9GLOM|nr:4016_t:CDS:2 [Funneliformis geosporum]